ncbi:MAG: hypothetical protein IT444_11170 [Phycisphaeraceae bacterium]|nr:hypothetical protein [Phycisphaeraceae bacterium]
MSATEVLLVVEAAEVARPHEETLITNTPSMMAKAAPIIGRICNVECIE